MVTIRLARALRRNRTWSGIFATGVALLLACTVMWLSPGHAFAQGAAVTIPSGPFADGQSITVTGTGGGFRSGDHFSAGRWDYKVIRWSLRYA